MSSTRIYLLQVKSQHLKAMQSFISWISEPIQKNLIVFEDGSECGASKYQQTNQSLLLPFAAFHLSNCIYSVIS